jgi:Cu2+-exporting ATPase
MSAEPAACFHCGLPVPAGSHWSVTIDAVAQPMCCPGCEAVAHTIVDNHLQSYYRERSSFSVHAGELVPDALKLYDTPELAARFTSAVSGESAVTLSVEGIRCAACVWLIEKRLAQVPGLSAAHLNVATEKLQVRWDSAQCKPSDILQAVREVGYVAYPFDPVQHGEQLRNNARTLFRQLFIAGLSMMQVMMYAVPVYLAQDGTMEPAMAHLMRWASLLLTLPAVLYSARPFFKGAWRDIRHGAPGMDVPVALGIAAGFLGSVAATLHGSGDVYFDSVTMFIFLLLCSRYLELVARRKAAGALETMQHALPASAALLKNFPASRETTLVAAAQLQCGDIIQIKPGEAIAADGIIIEGDTSVDLSLLTGESQPQIRQCGAALAGGAVNASQTVLLRVDKPVQDSTLSALIRLIERAGQAKPQIAQWADQVAAWFVTALLLFALAVFAYWSWQDASRAWPIAIAVLVVSCPCALSLATPSALAAATDRLLRQGVLVVQPHVLETLHRATHIVFDKTGTLTAGRPQLQGVTLLGNATRQECLQLAAALESASAHPLSRALVAAAPSFSRQFAVDAIETVNGRGLQGFWQGQTIRIGNAAFVAELAGTMPLPAGPEDVTAVYLGSSAGWLARFDLADAVKSDAQQTINYFKARGQRVILLSGDTQNIAAGVAQSLHMDEAHGAMLPEQKMAFVQRLQQQGAVVAMVGDGINDAAVLRAADVSFAMGSGAALAQSHADTVLLSGQLSALLNTARTAAQTMGVIRQNLVWATLYNLLAIPAAALGLLSPWMAGVGMSASSALVVLNALRLARLPRNMKSFGN